MGFAVPCVALWDCSLAQFVVFFCDENQGQLVLAWLQCCEHHFKTWRRLGLCSMAEPCETEHSSSWEGLGQVISSVSEDKQKGLIFSKKYC